MLAIGIGSALCLPAFTVAVMGGVEPDSRGIASGVLNACRQAGGVLGVGIFGSVVAGASFTTGLHAALLMSAVLILVAAIAAALFVASQKRDGLEAGVQAYVDAAVAD